jgi:hypothetical protein
MEWVSVISSVLSEVGYDALRQTLGIRFKSGAVYYYYWVPDAAHKALMSADSKGTYFNKHIKGSYEHQMVEEPFEVASKKQRRPKSSGGGKQSLRGGK